MRRDLDALTAERFDLLILGGGITGAGVAFDAAARGWRVALIDKGDFASGTSSVSSKLIHGGLRYLEHGQLPLVYEALHERAWLLRAAPHLVRPLRFVLPFYDRARLRPWQWRLGLTLYDLLAGAGNISRSRPLHKRDIQREWPGLRASDLLGGAAYFDAQMDDARLCLAVIQSAVDHRACVANYVQAVAFTWSGGAIDGVLARDRVSGGEFHIHARQVLNATGPWVDAVCRLAGDQTVPHLAVTKGVHIVLPDRQLPAALLLLHPRDGRVFFVIPWLGKTLVGTTDTDTPLGPDDVAVLPEDIDYLLEGWRRHFPGDPAPPVLGSFAGLRPLIRHNPGEPSSRSREFRIFGGPSGLISVAGGKYTTFRAMAEAINDSLGRRLGRNERSRTHQLRLHGSPTAPWLEFASQRSNELQEGLGLPHALCRRLVERYGLDVAVVANYLKTAAAQQPIVAGEPELSGELDYQRDHELAIRPHDHFCRRTRLATYTQIVDSIPAGT